MTILTFYGGVNEVGGNKILLEEQGTKVFLDFGVSFSGANLYFDEFLQPRKCNGMFDLIELGLLPDLKGIYRCDYLEHCQRQKEEKGIDAVLLSHAHMDHCSYIHYLRQDIPIYCTQASRDIMQSIDDTGSTGKTELVWFKDSFKTYRNTRGGISRLTGEKTEKLRSYQIIDRSKFKINDLEIEALPVSHSLEGANAYIIHSEKGPIIYTGDLRFHGYKGGLTKEFVKYASSLEPIAMICEGTRIDDLTSRSELEVKEEIRREVEPTKGLVIANFPVRDTDRMKTFLEVAKETGRSLVINLKQAYLLELFESGIEAPKVDDENIRIYAPRKSWGLIGNENFPKKLQYEDYDCWEREFLDHKNLVTAKEIRSDQSSYIFRCDFFELKELIDILPQEGSRYIRSVCEPFDLEMEINQEKVNNWLRHFNLYPYIQTHASGHLNQEDLKGIIQEISPKKMYPVHTANPEKFADLVKGLETEICKTEKGRPYEI